MSDAVTNKKNLQILKTRSDSGPIKLECNNHDEGYTFTPIGQQPIEWCPNGDIQIRHLRDRVEPWLTALFQSEHLSLLIGSGLTHAVHHMATQSTLPGMAKAEFGCFQDVIVQAARYSAQKVGRSEGNIEDQIRVANEILCCFEHFLISNQGEKQNVDSLKIGISNVLSDFSQSILDGERNLVACSEDKRDQALQYAVSFLMSFASRSGTRDRLNIFTTNYDRYIECAAEIAGIHLIDRFVGSLCPIFRSSRLDIDMHYNPPGIRGEPRYLEGVARFTKLHGSIDWVYANQFVRRTGLPFGAKDMQSYLKTPNGDSSCSELMIYPNSTKDRETASYPYVELFRDFASAVCRPNTALVTFGYSFGDEHINRVIEDMLTIPSTHLVIISYNDPLERIKNTYSRVGRPAQITLMLGNVIGDLKFLVDNLLPKPAIDRISMRMNDLIRSRIGSETNKSEELTYPLFSSTPNISQMHVNNESHEEREMS